MTQSMLTRSKHCVYKLHLANKHFDSKSYNYDSLTIGGPI